MSRGLGKVERRILEALQATERPYAALYELTAVVAGLAQNLDESKASWQWWMPICAPHPSIKTEIGVWVDHCLDCYRLHPTESTREATSRVVRSLTRKGLVEVEYEGGGLKRLVVCLAGTDRALLPKATHARLAFWAELHAGLPMPVTRWVERRYQPRPRKRK
jgi:hypothetical protein